MRWTFQLALCVVLFSIGLSDGFAGTDHWALRPLERPNLPHAHSAQLLRTSVDSFVASGLEEAGLDFSKEADKRTLIRRAFFTITGLPSSPEEIAAFIADDRSDAFERLVDKLLDSPGYGERWARHWLDVVRFAESNGFETNLERKNAWPYRDYVIRAFNEDKPYDQFVREQIAGDAFGVDEATGFIVGGPWDAVKSPDINLTAQQRMDELHDMVATTASAFLGLTLGCARCHDHKFDPIAQRDYYAVQAIFAGVQHGERELHPPGYSERMAKAKELRAKLGNLENELAAFEPLADPKLAARPRVPSAKLNEETFAPIEAKFVRLRIEGTFDNIEPCVDELEIFGAENPSKNLALAANGAVASASGTFSGSDKHQLKHANDGAYGNARSWISNERGKGWIMIELPQPAFVTRVLWGRDREEQYKDRLARVYSIEAGLDAARLQTVAGNSGLRPAVNAHFISESFRPESARFLRFVILQSASGDPCLDELEVFTAGANPRNIAPTAKVTSSGDYTGDPQHRLDHLTDSKYGNAQSWISARPAGWVQLEFQEPCVIGRVVWSRDREGKFKDRLATNYLVQVAAESNEWRTVASSWDRLDYTPSAAAEEPVRYRTAPENQGQLTRLLEQKSKLEKELKEVTAAPKAYSGRFEQPGPTYRLHRGEALQKREQVVPAVINGIGRNVALSENSPEQERRLAFANWIADRQNPLTARVMANRIWQFCFGEGIVSTPSDFGRNGAAPINRELLDWLACELIDSGWSIKHVERLILTSTVFRQASEANPDGVAKDFASRLLWRFPPQRLEAESLRDALLAVAGNLDRRMGGPGFDLFEPNGNYVKVYNSKQRFGPAEWRRMVYQSKPRMQLDDTFGTFDCPDAGQIAPKRNVSTTPLQALNLLNSGFSLQQAELFADRLQRECSGLRDQIARGFNLAFGRDPNTEERRRSEELIKSESLVVFCRALVNANEFLYFF